MDYTRVLNTLQNDIPTAIRYLIPFFLVAAVIKSPWFKGEAGEAVVNLSDRLFLGKTRYRRIKNVILPTEDVTTYIDQIIVVSSSGVFVVETKNTKTELFFLPTSMEMAEGKKAVRHVIRQVYLSGDKPRWVIREYGVTKRPGIRERGVSNGFFEWNYDSCCSFIS
ncbi:NERD domain-containing protein [Marinobacter salsuginis]|uniref:NERD domain-containing protein n=1 Tax=Marinobacter salsuginis TaxID=418719 RepID=UPI001C98109C|nr:NERD domain-containing protein [Marinobacter salsuginis]MBY6071229.1 NERD domain-containing protein [Marinobacter salsuginis]